jgi:hypothetical protein
VLEHNAIRFSILFVLYYYYYSESPEKATNIKKIVEDTELAYINQDINADIVYLYNKSYIQGQFHSGTDVPTLVKISPKGIDKVESTLEAFESYLIQKATPTKDEATVKSRLENRKTQDRLSILYSIFRIYPAIFDEYSHQVRF